MNKDCPKCKETRDKARKTLEPECKCPKCGSIYIKEGISYILYSAGNKWP